MSEYVTVAEWRKLGESSFAKFSNDQKLLALGQMLDVATPDEASMFLETLPAPIRLLWRIAGRRRYTRYRRALSV